jgi:hypothetical protein
VPERIIRIRDAARKDDRLAEGGRTRVVDSERESRSDGLAEELVMLGSREAFFGA